MAGLLYPAYQKYYSAICSLKRFGAEKNFFDNISNLDSFFSEYRSVTLVMQKSLAHSQHIDTYNKLSPGLWDKFFNDQRVKTIHTHPVEFTKEMEITVYSPRIGVTVATQVFTVENDVPFTDVMDSLREFLHSINPVEVFFSVRFSFIEKDTGADLWDKLMAGLATMRDFMDRMYSEIGEECPLCDKLRHEIGRKDFMMFPRDMFLVADYAYYPQKEEFERAGRIAMVLMDDDRSPIKRISMANFMSAPFLKNIDSAFGKFVVMNALIGTSDLMPTIMTVYQDGTYELESFHADMKTTIYRKINETADRIMSDDIKEVFVMLTYVTVDYDENLMKMTSKERLEKGTKEYLAFMRVDCELTEEEIVFDGKYIGQAEYVACQLLYSKRDKLDAGADNMMPIVEAFKARKMKEKH